MAGPDEPKESDSSGKEALKQLARFESLPENQGEHGAGPRRGRGGLRGDRDEVYEDDEEGDYNAEGFFDGGEDDGDDNFGGDAGEEAIY